MKKVVLIEILALLAMLTVGCATTEVKNIVRKQPAGKIEALTVKIESGFTLSKEGTKLKKAVADELQKNGIKVEQITEVVLNIEIEDLQIPSAASR